MLQHDHRPNGDRAGCRRRASFLSALAILACAAPWTVAPADAAGLLKPSDGGAPLAIEEHQVRVDINNGIAATEVVQVFRNDGPNPLEAVYSFPLPPESSLAGFSMWINGQEMTGEVVERKRAREMYDSIVRPAVPDQQTAAWRPPVKDPGLVEEVSYREFQVTIFPVPARGTQRVRLVYYEYLKAEDGRLTYLYPMETRATEDSRAHGRFSIEIGVRSVVPIVESTFPGELDDQVRGETVDPHHLRATLTRADGDLDRDFIMSYVLNRDAPGLDLISYRAPGEAGYFMALATVPPTTPRAAPVDYTFIVDVSGSMRQRQRLAVAGEALARFLESCPAEDRFQVIAFNVAPHVLSPDALANDRAGRDALIDFLAGFRGVGGTDLYPALEKAYTQAAPGRRHAIVVVSDGGLNDLDEDHGRFLRLARGRPAVIFGLAIGNDANVPLLQALATETGGFTAQVSGSDDLTRRGAALRERMRQEPLRDLHLTLDGDAELIDVVPARIPDLYPGRQVAILGRYRGSGDVRWRLHGTSDGEPVVLEAAGALPQEDRLNPEIRRLWAERKAFDLLQQTRAGRLPDAARDAVVRLGVDYSIVTPHTSFIVLESDRMFSDFGIERRNRALLEEESQARAQRARAIDARAVAAESDGPRSSPLSDLGGAVDPLLLAAILLLAAGPVIVRRLAP
ncbi:MAG TPA: VIT and VWA domain-containing protein [Candidatus Polarisedimenticolia bacterium]|nr:VIT and VWA domain-containing protein [Candidatus Polarisedimenticolia bacterium]